MSNPTNLRAVFILDRQENPIIPERPDSPDIFEADNVEPPRRLVDRPPTPMEEGVDPLYDLPVDENGAALQDAQPQEWEWDPSDDEDAIPNGQPDPPLIIISDDEEEEEEEEGVELAEEAREEVEEEEEEEEDGEMAVPLQPPQPANGPPPPYDAVPQAGVPLYNWEEANEAIVKAQLIMMEGAILTSQEGFLRAPPEARGERREWARHLLWRMVNDVIDVTMPQRP